MFFEDSELNNKIVFDENGYLPRDKNKRKYNSKYEPKGQNSTQRKYELFDEKDVDQDEINFRVKNQFEGKKGQKVYNCELIDMHYKVIILAIRTSI